MRHFAEISGWVALLLGAVELLGYFARRFQIRQLRLFRGKNHMLWGKVMIAVVILHSISAYWHNACCIPPLLLPLALWLTYRLRKRLGKKWIQWHRILAACLVVAIGFHLQMVIH